MTRILPIAALLLVVGCGQSDPQPAPAEQTAAAPAAPAAKKVVPSLAGRWRVAEPAPLDLTIGGGKATLSSGCLRRGYTFSQDRNRVTFTSSPGGSDNCGRTPSAAEEAAFAALADANLAVFSPDGGEATLSGLGGILTLERR